MFFLSWRQLVARKKQTLLIVLGISFGTLLFVSISGLQLGMRKYIVDRLLNNTAHVIISGAQRMIEAKEVTEAFYGDNTHVRWILNPFGKREETRLENYQGWYHLLSTDSDVLDFSPRLTTNAILSNGSFTAPVGITGVIPERHRRITSIETYMKEGTFRALESGTSSIIIGSEVARNLGARVDHFINVSSGKGSVKPFKVVGIVHFGSVQIDNSIAFAELSHVQTLTKSPGRVSEIAVALYDIDKANIKAQQWKQIGTDKVEDWKEANKMFLEMIQVQDYTRYFITVAILIVAAFGIYNVLTIMINQKKKKSQFCEPLVMAPMKS